jgi:Mce-associated membrane protein
MRLRFVPKLRRDTVRRILVAVSVAAVGVAGWFGTSLYNLKISDTVRNVALVDGPSTQQVVDQVGQAIRTAFSYDYVNASTTEQAARNLLAGNAVEQYTLLFSEVQRSAAEQKLAFSSTVRSLGVKYLEGDDARVVAFVDQQGIRADTGERRSGSAQLTVSAHRFDSSWKIVDIAVH